MEKKQFGEKLKSGLSSAINKAKESVQSIKKPDFNLPDIKVPEKVKTVFNKKEKSETIDPYSLNVISTKSAIQIIYYLMATDGKVLGEEQDFFDSICNELDPEFSSHKEDVIGHCADLLANVAPDNYLETIRDGIDEAIASSAKKEDSFITPKLLVWDLMSIAGIDDDYDESEKTIINYIGDRYNIEAAVVLEMENGMLTIIDLERELQWIKSTNRPYKEVEPMVNEIDQRRSVIFDSVKDLISL